MNFWYSWCSLDRNLFCSVLWFLFLLLLLSIAVFAVTIKSQNQSENIRIKFIWYETYIYYMIVNCTTHIHVKNSSLNDIDKFWESAGVYSIGYSSHLDYTGQVHVIYTYLYWIHICVESMWQAWLKASILTTGPNTRL